MRSGVEEWIHEKLEAEEKAKKAVLCAGKPSTPHISGGCQVSKQFCCARGVGTAGVRLHHGKRSR